MKIYGDNCYQKICSRNTESFQEKKIIAHQKHHFSYAAYMWYVCGIKLVILELFSKIKSSITHCFCKNLSKYLSAFLELKEWISLIFSLGQHVSSPTKWFYKLIGNTKHNTIFKQSLICEKFEKFTTS